MTTVAVLLQKLTKGDAWIDDGIDRITRRYTVAIVAVQLLVVYGGGFMRGNYIQCFTPKYFTGAQEKYSERLCWLESTHYIIEPENGDAVNDVGALGFYNAPIYKTTGGKSGYVGPYHPGQRVSVSYYQWVPIFLIFMALLSYVPFIVWKHMALKSGLPLKSIVTAARQMSGVDSKGEKLRTGLCEDVAGVLTRYSDARRSEKSAICGVGRKNGNVVFYSYLLIKILYIVTFVGMLLLLQLFLGNDPRFNILSHGAWVLAHLFTTFTWPQHPAFPVDTTCVIMAEQQGNPLPYTLQCILPMNLYFEKFFALYTVAFPVAAALFFCSLVAWLRSMSARGRRRFLESHLVKPLALDDRDGDDVDAFHDQFLLKDGVFALELIKMNVGSFVCEAVMEALWRRFLSQRRCQEFLKSAPSSDGDGSGLKKRPSAPFVADN